MARKMRNGNAFSRRDFLKGTAALGLAVGSGTLGACGQGGGPAKGGPVTLTLLLWEHWKVADALQKGDPTNVPKRRLWFYESIKRFESEHKDIKLEYQTANWNVATQSFIAASQAGNPPDLLGAQSQDSQPMATAGYVADLGQFKYEDWNDFSPAVLKEACTVGGKIVAMPTYITSTGLGYNKVLLREAGFAEPPKTWEELIRVGKAVTKDTRGTGRPNQWGYGCELSQAATPNPVSFTMPMIRSAGGQIVDENGRGLMDTPVHRKVITLLSDMYNEHKILSPESLTMKANDQVEYFANKTWVTGVTLFSLVPPILEKMTAETFGFVPHPTFPGEEPRSYGEVYCFLMSSKAAKDPRKGPAAWELLKELGSVKTMALCGKYQFGAPSRKSALADPIYKADPLLSYLSEHALKTSTPFPFVKEVGLYAETYIEAVNLIMIQRKPVDEVLKAQQAKYDAKLKA